MLIAKALIKVFTFAKQKCHTQSQVVGAQHIARARLDRTLLVNTVTVPAHVRLWFGGTRWFNAGRAKQEVGWKGHVAVLAVKPAENVMEQGHI